MQAQSPAASSAASRTATGRWRFWTPGTSSMSQSGQRLAGGNEMYACHRRSAAARRSSTGYMQASCAAKGVDAELRVAAGATGAITSAGWPMESDKGRAQHSVHTCASSRDAMTRTDTSRPVAAMYCLYTPHLTLPISLQGSAVSAAVALGVQSISIQGDTVRVQVLLGRRSTESGRHRACLASSSSSVAAGTTSSTCSAGPSACCMECCRLLRLASHCCSG